MDASAILNKDRLQVFITNRSLDETAPVQIHLADGSIARLENGELITGSNAQAANSFEQPDIIKPHSFSECTIVNGCANLKLAPLSVSAMMFRLE